ncbi:MAG: isochorismatase family protein [Leptospiraceae bacterium]|nr:isochorismatase family protein [Leptospiraceae bacterium]MCK6381921.1 isochorismatase family protein [Leptospiraceae bacterium]NUM41980.1 isochorismatase family protein [Leptospiraceae bacterium]
MRILKEESILIVVDIQEKLEPVIFDFERIVYNSRIVIEGIKALEIPILVTEQYPKGLGPTVAPIVENLGEFYKPIEKKVFSVMDSKVFKERLNDSKAKNVILIGIQSDVCVLQSSIDLLENGFIPVVVEDCVSAKTLEEKRISLERIRTSGGVTTTSLSILFELCRSSESSGFKKISKLVTDGL